MDCEELATWWDEAFAQTVWSAAWGRAIEGLTAEHAAWRPAPGRHSIWEIVNHMSHWHEYFVHRAEGGAPAEEAALDQLNWQRIEDVNDEAWRAAVARFNASHALVSKTMRKGTTPPKPELDLRYLLLHDSYHIGQVMFIRSLLALKPLES